MPRLSAVEAGPHIAVVVVDDLTRITLWGLMVFWLLGCVLGARGPVT